MAREPIVERLLKLDTCAVSDGMDRLGLVGATYGVRPMWPCPRIVGRAVTMKIKPVGLEKPKHHLGTLPIDAAKPGDVIVIDNGGRPDTYCWGGLLALAAKTKSAHTPTPSESRSRVNPLSLRRIISLEPRDGDTPRQRKMRSGKDAPAMPA